MAGVEFAVEIEQSSSVSHPSHGYTLRGANQTIPIPAYQDVDGLWYPAIASDLNRTAFGLIVKILSPDAYSVSLQPVQVKALGHGLDLTRLHFLDGENAGEVTDNPPLIRQGLFNPLSADILQYLHWPAYRSTALPASGSMRVLLAGQTNLNENTTGTLVELNPNLAMPFSWNTIPGATVNPFALQLPAGAYDLVLDVSTTGAIARSNLGLRILLDGALYYERHGGNYIRAASGHNEAGDSLADSLLLSSPATVSFEMYRQAGTTGAITLDGTRSKVIVTKR